MTLPNASQAGSLAVVTGGASGIGLAAAHGFAARGKKVMLVDLPGGRLDAALGTFHSVGEAVAFPTDVSDLNAVRELERSVRAQFGPIAVFMANAGIQSGTVVGSDENWQCTIAVNLWGVTHLTAGRKSPPEPGLQPRPPLS